MTSGECELWRSVYATSWHGTGWRLEPGPISDEERARWCALQADRALAALRDLAGTAGLKLGDHAAEVLR